MSGQFEIKDQGLFWVQGMETYRAEIDRKYSGIAKIPEVLFNFTSAIRSKAVGLLDLTASSAVLDVGCGTGASFRYLEDAVGEHGKILGIEPSPSMLAVARDRVQRRGWKNIRLLESTIEEIEIEGSFDGALLFAMHDVFNSPTGLQKIHLLLKPSARIVCVGPKLQERGALRVLNPFLDLMFKRMALSQENKDKPWRLVDEVFERVEIIEEKSGLIFIYIGSNSRGCKTEEGRI